MLMKLRIGFRILIQRLNRLIWLRRLRCITRLTERQLKRLWLTNQLLSQLLTAEDLEADSLIRRICKVKVPLPLTNSVEVEQTLADLQMSSSRLTTILQGNPSYGMSSRRL